MRRNIVFRTKWIVSVVGALAVAGAIAYAAIPDPGGVIHGCYSKANGILRVIDPSSSSCSSKEVAIAWNQAGPAGPAEPAGPPRQAPSSAASHFVVYNLLDGAQKTTFIPLGDLAGQNSDESNHQITVPFAGRILAIGQIHIINAGGVAVRGYCRLRISDGTGPQNGLTAMGEAVWHTVDLPPYDLTVPVVGYAVKPAGTYNVVVECEQLAMAGSTAGNMSGLIVWATAN
jgi:hypothetical protein